MAKRSRIKRRGKYNKNKKPADQNGATDIQSATASAELGVETVAASERGLGPSATLTVPPSEFEQIVAESQAALEKEKPTPRAGARKRGRPRKVRPQESQPSQVAGAQNPQPIVATDPAPDISEIIKTPLIALSKIPAHRHGIPELALSSDEAGACAQALNGILQAFVPDQNAMSPKTAAVVMGLLTFGSVGFTKFSIYSAEMEKRAPQKPVVTVQDEIAEIQKQSPVNASDYFRKEIAQ
jgi:hypothetical protein